MSNSPEAAPFAYPRLCLAYFLQFAIWGSWAGALGGYAGHAGLEGVGWLYAAIPLGAVISPMFIGPIADRYFSAQKVISFLHLIGSLALIACGVLCMQGKATFPALMALILLSGMCYMPTIALLNSVVFKHSKEGSAPYVFVFGTFGWIVVNLFIAAFLGGAETPNFFFAGGGCGLLLALYALTLPDTPPKGAPAVGEKSDLLGLGALKLFKDPGFAIFVLCAFLASILACNFYFPFQVPYLSEQGYPSPVALTTLNQFSELFFMSLLPFAIAVIGLKWVVVLGIGSWALRYFLFMQTGSFGFAVGGLFLHGFAYSFLYAASYMYADKKAPAELKASVQSLMAFLLLGVGQVLGSVIFGEFMKMETNAPDVKNMAVASAEKPVGLPGWTDAKMVDSSWKYLDLAGTVQGIMNPPEKTAEPASTLLNDLYDYDTNKDNTLTAEEIAAGPDSIKIGDTVYARADIDTVLRSIAKAAPEAGYSVERGKYLEAKAHKWKQILFPAVIWISIFFVIFVIFGKDPEKGAKDAEPSEELRGEGPKEDPAGEAATE